MPDLVFWARVAERVDSTASELLATARTDHERRLLRIPAAAAGREDAAVICSTASRVLDYTRRGLHTQLGLLLLGHAPSAWHTCDQASTIAARSTASRLRCRRFALRCSFLLAQASVVCLQMLPLCAAFSSHWSVSLQLFL